MYSLSRFTSLVLLVQQVFAAVRSTATVLTPTPSITQRALLRRANVTAGYYSMGPNSGTNLWLPLEYDPASEFFTTSGSLFTFCTSSEPCALASCGNGYLTYENGTVEDCLTSALECESIVSYTASGDTDPKSAFFCADNEYAPLSLYGKTEELTSTSPSTSSASITSTPTPSPTASSTPAPTSSDEPPLSDPARTKSKSKKGKPKAGVIAGSVIGSLALISLISAVLTFLRRRQAAQPKQAVEKTYYEHHDGSGDGVAGPAGVGSPVAQYTDEQRESMNALPEWRGVGQ
ncbi:hypothetical protein BDV95DRAFT_563299 [Massariosphaeria phaeospora]|uniref:Mid2 domain-containing protein n=1 Tax=Massariosphaeria phaeospora TaxID=100035 RepID=A0A7C8IG83_9PLEO|nr:hypothetical protein BDV95DRAFT_563299 [Massariosphaeria phaeospora]